MRLRTACPLLLLFGPAPEMVRTVGFLLLSLLRGRLAFAVWELAEVAERRALMEGDVVHAARVHQSLPARWARKRLQAQGADLAGLRRRLHAMLNAIERRPR